MRAALFSIGRILHGRTGRITSRLGNGTRDHRHSSHENVVADLDVADHADATCNHAVAPDLGAAGNSHAASHRGVVADLHVVRNHDLVVELDAVANQRVGERTTVDGRVGADLDVVANAHAADLGDLLPGTFSLAKPNPSPPITAPDWMTTRLPICTS